MKTRLSNLLLISVIWVISGTTMVSAHGFEDTVLPGPPNLRIADNSSSLITDSGDSYTIPVVYWVVMRNATDTLVSKRQIDSSLAWMNRDFANDKGFGPNSGLSFALAQLDPHGIPTTGVKYVDGSILPAYSTYGINVITSATGFSAYEFGNYNMTWDHTRYINIYIVDSIYNGYGGVTANTPSFYGEGIFIKASELPRYDSHVLSHETGHYFDLLHTFEGDNGFNCPSETSCSTQGDKVCDTPLHRSIDAFTTTPCSAGADILNSLQNFMSYGSTKNRFTAGQITRVRNYLLATRSLLTSGDAFVKPTPSIEIAVTAIENQPVVYSCGKFDFEFTIKNEGRTTITSCKAEVSIDGGSPVTAVISVGIANGQSKTCLISVPVSLGSHAVCVQVSDFNGSLTDSIIGNNSLCKTINFQKKLFYVGAQKASTDLTVTGTDNYYCGDQVNLEADFDTMRFQFKDWKDDIGKVRSASRFWSFIADSNAIFTASVEAKIITTGIGNNYSDEFVKIYPNPVTDHFNVELKNSQLSKLQLEVIDIIGRTVLQIQELNTSIVDISQLPAGSYIVHISDDQHSNSFKILKN